MSEYAVEFVAEDEVTQQASMSSMEMEGVPGGRRGPALAAQAGRSVVITEDVTALRAITAFARRQGVRTLGAETPVFPVCEHATNRASGCR